VSTALDDPDTTSVVIDPTILLRKDLKRAADTLGPREARFLVDLYYQIQDYRLATNLQILALGGAGEPHLAIGWARGQMADLEATIRAVLDRYTMVEPTGMGAWSRAIVGVGPVLAAGLLAHLDITRAPTAGHFWRFAGLDPTLTWERGQKRPWNAQLKVICWKLGQSFMKVQNHPKDIYGHLYVERKAYEQARNGSPEIAAQAAQILATRRIGKDTEAFKAYAAGRLPPAQIDARARRWSIKLFLAHYHGEAYRRHYGIEPPLPYAIAQLGHAHLIERPNPTR
jgi:hypothetical protein